MISLSTTSILLSILRAAQLLVWIYHASHLLLVSLSLRALVFRLGVCLGVHFGTTDGWAEIGRGKWRAVLGLNTRNERATRSIRSSRWPATTGRQYMHLLFSGWDRRMRPAPPHARLLHQRQAWWWSRCLGVFDYATPYIGGRLREGFEDMTTPNKICRRWNLGAGSPPSLASLASPGLPWPPLSTTSCLCVVVTAL
jgi:hypothetical protein